MLADILVFSQLYALPIWGPSLGVDATSRSQRLCNHAVRVTCGLKKYDHVSAACHTLGWLTFDSLVQHHTLNLMSHHYTHADCVQLDPPFQFGPNHSYATRQPPHFCNIFRYSTSFGQRYFRSQATTWWNHLPHSLFDFSPIDFSHHLYEHLFNLWLYYVAKILCVCMFEHSIVLYCCIVSLLHCFSSGKKEWLCYCQS